MNLFESCGGREDHPAYKQLAASNLDRQFDFLRASVDAAMAIQAPVISHAVIKALNFHVIACLHSAAGEYRPCMVTVGQYVPPAHWRVPDLMDQFVNDVNVRIPTVDPVLLSAYVLWRMNWVHPFINGNGRTARATCYYVLCVANGGWLPGAPIVPELIENNRPEYYAALHSADAGFNATGTPELADMHALLVRLVNEQTQGVANP